MSAKSAVSARRGRPPKGSGAVTRERLLTAALELFAQKGFAATTVREIAEAVGIRDSAIYAHFEGKQQIFDALLTAAGPGLFGDVGIDLGRLAERHPGEAIPELFGRLVEAWDEPRLRQLASVVIREDGRGLADVAPQVFAILRGPFELWRERRLMRNDVPVDLLIWELVSPLAAMRMIFLNTHASAEERRLGKMLAAQHLDYFVATMRPNVRE